MADWRQGLIDWYRVSARDLPWRRTRDPYAIWLSEVMSQQTRIDTVIPYWFRFMAAFPTVQALAAAPDGEVMSLWAGLGYYSRARALLKAARAIVADHGGRLPADVAALEALPGIGRYTAGAIASVAFGIPAPVVDGNVLRVLSRYHGIRESIDEPKVKQRIWELATDLVWTDDPSAWNQGLMELGARVCMPPPKTADCDGCPISSGCIARAKGLAAELPLRSAKRAPSKLEWIALALTRPSRGPSGGDEILLARRVPSGLFGGLWELPASERAPRETAGACARRLGRALLGAGISPSRAAAAVVEHTLTHRLLTIRAHRAAVPARAKSPTAPPGYDRVAWLPRRELGHGGKHALSTATVRVLAEI